MPEKIATDAKALEKYFIIAELPIVLCARLCRGKKIIVCEGIVAYLIAKALEWKQIFADDASRRQACMVWLVLKANE